jgi:hypothetical protein
MPWKVKKSGTKWIIVKADTGETVGHSDSEQKARASVGARYAAENKKDKKV